MNRIDRLTAILIQLQGRRIVKAKDIAERFDITLRTVYRDIQALTEGGVPVIGEAGVGYTLMEGYRLPPVMFTNEEAAAFLTGEKLVGNFGDEATNAGYRSGMYKIKAVLRSMEKDYLETIEDHIEVLRDPRLPEHKHSGLQDIFRSIAGKHLLQLYYTTTYSDKHTQRNVEPVGVFHRGSYWYLIAYCHLRKDYRNFRVDGIKQLRVLEERFSREHPTLKQYLSQVAKDENLQKVVLQVDADKAGYLGEQKYYSGYVSQKPKDDKIEMTFLTASLEGFARWYLMIGDIARITSPATLKTRVKALLNTISKQIK